MKHCSTSALVTLCFVSSFCRTLGGTIRLMDEHFAEGASERQGGVYIRLRADRKTLHGAGCRCSVCGHGPWDPPDHHDRRGRAGLTWQVAAALHPGSWNASSGTALPCRPSVSSRPDRSDHRYAQNAMCPNARGRHVFNDGAVLPVATVRSPIDARGSRGRSLPIRLTAPAPTSRSPARSPPGQRHGRAGTVLLHASQRSLTRSRALVSRIAEWL